MLHHTYTRSNYSRVAAPSHYGKDPGSSDLAQSDPVHEILNSRAAQYDVRPTVQAKVKVGAANDKFEQEADQVADRVVSGGDTAGTDVRKGGTSVQRMCDECEDEVQMKAKGDGATQSATASAPPLNAGRSMPAGMRNYFEPRFGHDFSQVRVHNDNQTQAYARSINARAFTYGNHIGFAEGELNPSSREGKHLMAHELTHVLQQNGASVIQRAPSFEDCSTPQETVITAAVARGDGWVRTALSELRAALGGTMSASCGRLLTRDFHTHAPSDIRKIIAGFVKILAGLTGSVTYECESWCMGEKCGYVYGVWTDVHFCPSFFSTAASATFQARCLVHELAHKEAGAGRDTYEYDPGYSTLTPAQAINNADSYAVFARDI